MCKKFKRAGLISNQTKALKDGKYRILYLTCNTGILFTGYEFNHPGNLAKDKYLKQVLDNINNGTEGYYEIGRIYYPHSTVDIISWVLYRLDHFLCEMNSSDKYEIIDSIVWDNDYSEKTKKRIFKIKGHIISKMYI